MVFAFVLGMIWESYTIDEDILMMWLECGELMFEMEVVLELDMEQKYKYNLCYNMINGGDIDWDRQIEIIRSF